MQRRYGQRGFFWAVGLLLLGGWILAARASIADTEPQIGPAVHAHTTPRPTHTPRPTRTAAIRPTHTPHPTRTVPVVLPGVTRTATTPTAGYYFSETQHYVKGLFLRYWSEHGGLVQQGYPLTERFVEASLFDPGQSYGTQYFERAVFEFHPENAGTPYEVLLAQLGTYELKVRYPNGAPASTPSIDNPRFFAETGHTLGGKFRVYWESHGGLAQQGYPLTDEFTEVNRLTGQSLTVQYFERASFELHPENAGSPYEVLLTQLGKYQLERRYRNGTNPAAAPLPAPGATPGATGP